jgi:hypothetical protein
MKDKLKQGLESLTHSSAAIKMAASNNLQALTILYKIIHSKLTKEESQVLRASIENIGQIEKMVEMDKDLIRQTKNWVKANEKLNQKKKEIFLFQIEDKQLN